MLSIPREMASQILDRLLFAQSSMQRRNKSSNLADLHYIALCLLVTALLPFYIFIWFNGDWLIGVIAGNEWIGYKWVISYLIPINLLFAFSLSISPFMLAYYPHISSRLRFYESSLFLILLLYLGDLYGLQGVMIASLIVISAASIIRLYIMMSKLYEKSDLIKAYRLLIYASFITVPLVLVELLFNGDRGSPAVPELYTLSAYIIVLVAGLIYLRKQYSMKCYKSVI
jgi:O-antigen/teichoic acid export membrane protein